jgi:hypothetical protein
MAKRIVEYPAKVRGGRVVFPPLDKLERDGKPIMRASEFKALLRCKDTEVQGFLDWIEVTMPERCWAVGVFAWEIFDYRIERAFEGLVVYFRSAVDAVHCRLAWSDYCDSHAEAALTAVAA